MSTITFDTLKFANKLKEAGVPSAQAEAEASALAEVLDVNLKELTTKDDLKSMEVRLDAKIHVLQWMLGFLLAGTASLVIKTFF